MDGPVRICISSEEQVRLVKEIIAYQLRFSATQFRRKSGEKPPPTYQFKISRHTNFGGD